MKFDRQSHANFDTTWFASSRTIPRRLQRLYLVHLWHSKQPMFKLKHQKLVLQCYPPGKGVDKKPNPSELSYLLYYASTRRIKLEKVFNFISKRAVLDVKHNRAGNLQVTLAIMTALIVRCLDDLSVFAAQVCGVLQSILSCNDLALSKLALRTYAALCEQSNGALLPADHYFLHQFITLLESFIAIHHANNHPQGPNDLQWEIIALMSCRHISRCFADNFAVAERFIPLTVPVLAGHIYRSSSKPNTLLYRLKLRVHGEDESSHKLTKVTSAKTITQNYHIVDIDFENDSLTPKDVTEEAFRGLNALFDTTSNTQLSKVTLTLVQHIFSSDYEQQWGINLLALCTAWAPVQLRFVCLQSLLTKLNDLPTQPEKAQSTYTAETHYASYVLGLVSLDVNMIGLLVSDIIQHLLSLQQVLFLNKSVILSHDQVNDLASVYSRCVCNLLTHIYYFDQIPDSVQEILVKVDSVMEHPPIAAVDENHYGFALFGLVSRLLDDIQLILQQARRHPLTISRNHVRLEDWEMSLVLLAPQDEPEMATKLYLLVAQFDAIQQQYLKVFCEFLRDELATVSPLSPNESTTKAMTLTGLLNGAEFLSPNTSQYIGTSHNFLGHFLSRADKLLALAHINVLTAKALLKAIIDMISIAGANLVDNFIPFYFHWSLAQPDAPNAKLRDTIAHIVLINCILALDKLYPEELEGYGAESSLFTRVKQAIAHKREHDAWVSGFDELMHLSLSDCTSQANEPVVISRVDIQEFADGNAFTSEWIHPNKPLFLDSSRHLREAEARLTSTSRSDVASRQALTASEPVGTLGLGSATDIMSIHSEIHQQQQQHASGRGLKLAGALALIHTSDIPRRPMPAILVSHIKRVLSENRTRPSEVSLVHLTARDATIDIDESLLFGGCGLIISQHIITTDLRSIIGELDD